MHDSYSLLSSHSLEETHITTSPESHSTTSQETLKVETTDHETMDHSESDKQATQKGNISYNF